MREYFIRKRIIIYNLTVHRYFFCNLHNMTCYGYRFNFWWLKIRKKMERSALRAQRWRKPLEPEPSSQGQLAFHARPLKLLDSAEKIAVLYATPDGYPQRFRWRGEVHEVVRVEGPERIAPEWWRERGGARRGPCRRRAMPSRAVLACCTQRRKPSDRTRRVARGLRRWCRRGWRPRCARGPRR